MESSPGNYQAVIKVPRKSTDKDHANLFFKDLNRDLGDPKITGLVRPMRLAGFQNRKPKHATADGGRPPFVRVVSAVNRLCARALEVIQAYGQREELDLKKGAERRSVLRQEERPARPAPMSEDNLPRLG